jgi:hypothetical protein
MFDTNMRQYARHRKSARSAAGRIVAPDEGAHPDAEPDQVAGEAGPDMGGYTAEEAAMRVEPE